mgnify:CR=1 FL=1|jgi:hypothetical protein
MNPIIQFLRKEAPHPSGLMFDDVMALNNEAIEKSHDLVQWLFPLPEPSKAQPTAPYLSPDDLEELRNDRLARRSVMEAAIMMTCFLAGTTAWRWPRNHNHKRITRMIRCLTLIGKEEAARRLCDFACAHAPLVPDTTRWHWNEARNAESVFFTS